VTLDESLRRAARSLAPTDPIVAGGAMLRRRRRRARLGAAASVSVLAVSVGILIVRAPTSTQVQLVDEPSTTVAPAPLSDGRGASQIVSADGVDLGALPAIAGPVDSSIGWLARDELLDGPAADALRALGVDGPADERLALLADAGLTIRTTIDAEQNDASRLAVEAAIDEHPYLANSAAVAIDPVSGAVRAVIGPVPAVRAPMGSLMGAFAVGAAVEAGVPLDERIPAPASYTVSDGGPNGVTITNFGGTDQGDVDLTEAMLRQTNTALAALLDDGRLQPDAVRDLAIRAGLDIDTATPALLTSVFGTDEVGLLDAARSMATIAEGGLRPSVYVIDSITAPDGRLLYEAASVPERTIDPALASTMRTMLAAVIDRGTGTHAAVGDGTPQIGKTGTTPDQADAWFAGATPGVAVAVWVGRNGDSSTGGANNTGGATAAPLARLVTQALLSPDDPITFPS
jgi:membrane peptidoglycan carboxypeptidase